MTSRSDGQTLERSTDARWSEVCVRGHKVAFVGGLVTALGFSWYSAVYFVPMATKGEDLPENCRKKLQDNSSAGTNKFSIRNSDLPIADVMSVTMPVMGVVFLVLYNLYTFLACKGYHLLKTGTAFFIFTFCFLAAFGIFFQTVNFPMECFPLTSTVVAMVTMGAAALATLIASFLWLAAGFLCSDRVTWSARFGVTRGQGEGQPLLAMVNKHGKHAQELPRPSMGGLL